jgi:hypothetical protein
VSCLKDGCLWGWNLVDEDLTMVFTLNIPLSALTSWWHSFFGRQCCHVSGAGADCSIASWQCVSTTPENDDQNRTKNSRPLPPCQYMFTTPNTPQHWIREEPSFASSNLALQTLCIFVAFRCREILSMRDGARTLVRYDTHWKMQLGVINACKAR